jgi:hypothetical protein
LYACFVFPDKALGKIKKRLFFLQNYFCSQKNFEIENKSLEINGLNLLFTPVNVAYQIQGVF